MSNQLYTKPEHDAAVANLQRILDTGLELAKRLGIAGTSRRISGMKGKDVVEVSATPISETVGALMVTWGQGPGYLMIPYVMATGKLYIVEDEIAGSRQYQVSDRVVYSGLENDPLFTFDLIGLMKEADGWIVRSAEPRSLPDDPIIFDGGRAQY